MEFNHETRRPRSFVSGAPCAERTRCRLHVENIFRFVPACLCGEPAVSVLALGSI